MKSYIYGFIINIQFFSTIPLRVEVPMNKKHIERAIQMFPLLGLMQGAIYSGLLYALLHWTYFSDLAIAFLIWLMLIVITGGLHLDGWIDCSDALFSYRERAKRLVIMTDPRVGAFGVISVIVLLGARFLFIYEIVQRAELLTYLLILFVPLLGKVALGMFVTKMPVAKKEGLGFTFQQACQRYTLASYPVFLVGALALSFLWQKEGVLLLLLLLAATIVLFFLFRRKIIDAFGGITGDVLGAAAEGVEACLWMGVWLLHYYAMG